MKDLSAILSPSGRFLYSHENIKIVNALGRGIDHSEYRNNEAGIVDTENFFVHVFPTPAELLEKLDIFFEEHKAQNSIFDIAHAHCSLISIHPFSNGNGRTARFIADINLVTLGMDPFLNDTIDRKAYYGAVRDYLEGNGLENMVELIKKGK